MGNPEVDGLAVLGHRGLRGDFEIAATARRIIQNLGRPAHGQPQLAQDEGQGTRVEARDVEENGKLIWISLLKIIHNSNYRSSKKK